MRRHSIETLVVLAIVLGGVSGQAEAKVTKASKKADAVVREDSGSKATGVEYAAPVDDALVVSNRELNTFTFPGPVKRIIFPAGSPVVGEPIYLAGGTQVMLQFAASDTSIQMVAELADGTVQTLRIQPKPVQGLVYTVGSTANKPRRAAPAANPAVNPADPASMGQAAGQSSDPRAADVALLKRIVLGDLPDDFSAIDLPKPTRFDKFTIIPMSGWSDGASRRAYVFSLVANPGQTALVAPPQFYRPGITAVMLDGDVVDDNTSPLLYVLEEVGND